ncbi:MAG: hypothetical protein NPINA01_23260 [Nitrospinaceae bacterium]|nr:MAG: hypothetical protein NPINA01_23260 [Nitrospinaceae bacterium]
MSQEKIAETLILLQKVWVLLLIAVYFIGFMNEYHFPGMREEPLEGEEILWNAQKVLFFGMMCVGFLVDAVQMREDRQKAFLFLFLSLILGGFASWISAIQFQVVSYVFGPS